MTRTQYRLLALSALMATTLVAAPAFAKDGGPEGGRGGHHGEGPGGGMFKQADTNSDGFLTREEMDAAHKKRLDTMFQDLDTDKDGKLSQDEMKAGREKMRDKMRERMKDRRGDKGGPDDTPKSDDDSN